MKERSLIAFSLLTQTAVGAFLALGALHFGIATHSGTYAADRLTDSGLLGICLLMGLGLLASLFHLGTPWNAWRALTNLPSSWLSREIMFALGFTVFAVAFSGLQLFRLGPGAARMALAGLSSLVGLALIYSMARVYMLQTIPVWNTPATLYSFFITALLLGVQAAGLSAWLNVERMPAGGLFASASGISLTPFLVSWIGAGGLVLAGLQIATMRLPGAIPAEMGNERPNVWLYRLRMVLLVLGAGFSATLTFQGENSLIFMLGLAFVCFLISEIIGRSLFYEKLKLREL